MKPKQKLYCYVDETGQDAGSKIFITAAVVSSDDQHNLRMELEAIEKQTKIFKRKWYRAGRRQRTDFITRIMESGQRFGKIFYIVYKKPILFFLSWLEVIASALESVVQGDYRAQVYVDGIDHKKAAELTNTLRAKGVKLSFVKSARDETEAFIRLADRAAGLVRSASEQKGEYAKLLAETNTLGVINETKTTPWKGVAGFRLF